MNAFPNFISVFQCTAIIRDLAPLNAASFAFGVAPPPIGVIPLFPLGQIGTHHARIAITKIIERIQNPGTVPKPSLIVYFVFIYEFAPPPLSGNRSGVSPHRLLRLGHIHMSCGVTIREYPNVNRSYQSVAQPRLSFVPIIDSLGAWSSSVLRY
jgi:hypothetical protein